MADNDPRQCSIRRAVSREQTLLRHAAARDFRDLRRVWLVVLVSRVEGGGISPGGDAGQFRAATGCDSGGDRKPAAWLLDDEAYRSFPALAGCSADSV